MSTRNILRAAFFTPGIHGVWGLPLLLEGKPGMAKTSIVTAEARACGLHCEALIASIRAPEDFCGIPVPGKHSIQRQPDAWVDRVSKAERAVVFFDEFNCAPAAVQAALLRVIHERVAGNVVLPKTVRMIAAQNAVEDAAGGNDLSPAMANRFGHIAWSGPDVTDWTSYVLAGGAADDGLEPLNAEAEEVRVENLWGSAFAKARGLITGFLRRRPELFHKQPNASDPQASKAFPTPRSWELACRAYASGQVHMLNDTDADTFLSAFIGGAAASELSAWAAEADLPDPADLLDGKVKFKHNPKRIDRTAAILSMCAAFVAPKTTDKRLERASTLWKMLDEVSKDAVDVVVPAGKVLANKEVHLSHNIPEARPVLGRLGQLAAMTGGL